MIQKTSGRKQNLEQLRCIAMMMVVVLHFLGKGNILGDVSMADMSIVGMAAWVLEALCIVAVNVYMLISGYFLCQSKFKLNRLLTLYLQIWMYSAGVGAVAVWAGIVPADEINVHYFLSLLFPVTMGHYWFMTAYVFMYLLLPLVGKAIENLSKKQLKLALTLLLVAYCLVKTVLPFRLEEDGKGYDVLWYLCVFLIAAYIRRFDVGILKKRWACVLLYVTGSALALVELFVFRYIYLRTGSLGLILKISFEYNHLFVLMASVGLFGLFLHLKGEGVLGSLAAKVGPYVLGVYLLHENIGVRYAWQKLFGAESIETLVQLLAMTGLAVVTVFITGVIVEWIRSSVMKGLGKGLSTWSVWSNLMKKMEALGNDQAE